MVRTLVDIGANNGDFTAANMAKGKFDNYVLVEANPNLIPILLQRYKDFPNVKVYHRVATNKPQESFYLCQFSFFSTTNPDWLSSGARYPYGFLEKRDDIPTITIDQLVAENPSDEYFIKVDCEGGELQVVLSCTKPHGPMSIEYTEEMKEVLRGCVTHLASLGYSRFLLTQEKDEFDYQPDSARDTFVTAQDVYDYIDTRLDATKKSVWGMIYCYI